MDRSAYASMSAQESDHWWFVARRAILDSLIRTRVGPCAGARILEAGCGTGGNLAMLAAYGTLDALEYDDEARALAAARGIGRVEAGALPGAIGFGDTRYDMIALLDVLEHIDEDVASLAALGARLADGGRMLVTVPAMPWLWSAHDEVHHHKRRYTQDGLGAVAREAGLTVQASGYFNSLLFPLACVVRAVQAILRCDGNIVERPPILVNAALRKIFAAERYLIGKIQFPIGLSVYALVSRKGE